MYPDWQWKFWVRSFWYPKSDFVYGTSKALAEREERRSRSVLPGLLGTATVVAGIVAMVGYESDSSGASLQAKGRDLFAPLVKVLSV